MEEKVKRLKMLLSNTGMKQKDYAAKTDVTTGLVSKIMTGNAKISDNMEKKTIEIFNLNKEWWETGEGPIFKPGGHMVQDSFKGSYNIQVLVRATVCWFESSLRHHRKDGPLAIEALFLSTGLSTGSLTGCDRFYFAVPVTPASLEKKPIAARVAAAAYPCQLVTSPVA